LADYTFTAKINVQLIAFNWPAAFSQLNVQFGQLHFHS